MRMMRMMMMMMMMMIYQVPHSRVQVNRDELS